MGAIESYPLRSSAHAAGMTTNGYPDPTGLQRNADSCTPSAVAIVTGLRTASVVDDTAAAAGADATAAISTDAAAMQPTRTPTIPTTPRRERRDMSCVPFHD